MDDPGRRPDGVWPRDRPIRWGGVAGNLAWFVGATAAGLVQLALAIPILTVERGWANTVLALIWGGLTLFAGWCWVMGRWRIVLAPIFTLAALALASVV
jgi:thiamine transporter ThiT